MKRVYFSGLLLLLLCTGCEQQAAPQTVDTETAAAPKAAASLRAESSEPVSEQVVVSNVPLLAHGTHMVFGIRMPRGMMPMPGNGSVQRFEGTHSIEAVKVYLEEQLAGEIQIQPTRYEKGYFISNALPKSSQADLTRLDTSRKKYNIKIFEGSLGGAAVDVWEAKEGQAANEAEGQMANTSSYRNLVGKNEKKTTAPKVVLESKQQRERAAFRTFEKLATGKPLTEEDYQSPFFTDM